MNARFEASPVVLGQPDPAVSWQQRPAVAFAFILVLALALVLRGFLGPTGLHDSLAIYWVWADQFTAELARGTLYPRWLPASYGGLGAPVFYYYPPLAFYLTGAFGLAGLSTYASLIAAFGTAFAASGVGCWYWLRDRSNHPLIGAGFFMAAPYHLFDYVDRGALAESVAIALIPVLAIGLRRIAEKRGGIVATAVAYAAMIGTHLPLALLTSTFLIIPYAIRHRGRIAGFALASALGIGTAAIYLLPALALEPYHDGAQLYRAPNLRTDYWSLFSGNWSDPTFAMVVLIIATIALAAALIAIRQRDRWAGYAIAIALVVAGLLPFFWSLPLIEKVQFPYRALPIAELALATSLARLPRDLTPAIKIATIPLLVSLAILPGMYDAPRNIERLQKVHPDVYEYLPKGVLKANQTNASLSEVLTPRIPPPHVEGVVVEPRFYFPSWSCGTEEPRTKLLMHTRGCRPYIVGTAPERLGELISVLTGMALLLFGWASSLTGRAVARLDRIRFAINLVA